MKNKAKVLLMGIAMFAIVGGVVASKAKRGSIIFCSGTATTSATSVLLDKTISTTGDLSFCTGVLGGSATTEVFITDQP